MELLFVMRVWLVVFWNRPKSKSANSCRNQVGAVWLMGLTLPVTGAGSGRDEGSVSAQRYAQGCELGAIDT